MESNKAEQSSQPKRRGRPRVHASDQARNDAYRARKNLTQFNVLLPQDVADALRAYCARQEADGDALTISQVVAKLVTQQLLRKR